ncbi:class I SAM-dependent methyltransferase [Permianibacter sp. IMCC34836]|uniref:class I SAM-dependent methyltransferase n=1 Tax=Permianibacter fluminis TaxID=2738515 RepID=UPI00155166FD|nr:class I SAM-dependent methyltransferase [Permianibacter fluminis]NQD37951.1 class I SAM-dependent methyltransferase [Permianibacter fluminis]
MKKQGEPYVPALGFRFLTGLYDPVLRWTTRERRFKRALLAQARLQPDWRVLDLACGTGTLSIMAKQAEPRLAITGIDADSDVLARAVRKATRMGVEIPFQQGLATRLPYADASFDCVLSSLFFHHLVPDQKRLALAEVFRVLRPGGELHIADWGKANNALMRILFYSVQWLDGFSPTADHVAGRLPDYIREAGFNPVRVGRGYDTIYGSLALLYAIRP